MTESIEEEAREVISYILRKKHNLSVNVGYKALKDYELDIYGSANGITIIGEAKVRVGLGILRKFVKKVKYLLKNYPELFTENIILVIYGTRILEPTIEEASNYGIWLVTATEEKTKLRVLKKHEIEDILMEE